MIRMHLNPIDQYGQALADLDARIGEAMTPLAAARNCWCESRASPGSSLRVLLAETCGDMSGFPTAAHLVSWAGTAPGCNESAGRDAGQIVETAEPGNQDQHAGTQEGDDRRRDVQRGVGEEKQQRSSPLRPGRDVCPFGSLDGRADGAGAAQIVAWSVGFGGGVGVHEGSG